MLTLKKVQERVLNSDIKSRSNVIHTIGKSSKRKGYYFVNRAPKEGRGDQSWSEPCYLKTLQEVLDYCGVS